jgi:hypothetical protein
MNSKITMSSLNSVNKIKRKNRLFANWYRLPVTKYSFHVKTKKFKKSAPFARQKGNEMRLNMNLILLGHAVA